MKMNKFKAALFIAALVIASGGCARSDAPKVDEDYAALEREERPVCAPPSVPELRAWGKTGMSSGCYIQHGRFLVAEGGTIRFIGEYDRGSRAGHWKWFDSSGKVYKEKDYSIEHDTPEKEAQ